VTGSFRNGTLCDGHFVMGRFVCESIPVPYVPVQALECTGIELSSVPVGTGMFKHCPVTAIKRTKSPESLPDVQNFHLGDPLASESLLKEQQHLLLHLQCLPISTFQFFRTCIYPVSYFTKGQQIIMFT
jgi:hypothetical protein